MATAAKSEVRIEIPEIKIQKAEIRIVGTSPLVVHNFSEKARKMILDKQMKTAKTTAREKKNPVSDFIESLYWLTPKPKEHTEEAFTEAVRNGAKFGFKTTGIKESIVSAAYRSGLTKNKVVMYGAFYIDGEFVEIKGVVPTIREDMVRLQTGVADIRHRPEFPIGWYMDLPISFMPSIISLEQLASFITLGGFSCGIGEHRVEKGGQWGMYTLA
jgi:hypothetical protein